MTRLIGLSFIAMLALTVRVSSAAQTDNLMPYNWAEAGLSFSYPAGWDEPVRLEGEEGRIVLQLAQTLAAAPETRPPGIPIINLTVIPGGAPLNDFTPVLEAEMTGLGITLAESSPATLLGNPAMSATGTNEDGLLFGIARAGTLPAGWTLVVSGRAAAAQQAEFTDLFNTVADSIHLDTADIPTGPTYGVLWHTQRTLADGPDAFVNLTGLAYGANGSLYTVDVPVGVVQLDATSGTVQATYSSPEIRLPSDIAVSSEGIAYVADLACQCVLVLGADGRWREPITGFGPQAPFSLAVTPGGILYATDQTPGGITARVFTGDSEQGISFGQEVTSQPMLAISPDGSVLALTLDGQILRQEQTTTFTEQARLATDTLVVVDFAADEAGNLLLASGEQGIGVFNPDGEFVHPVGRLVAGFPLPGEFVRPSGVAAGTNGTIYAADSDGTFGAVTAMSTEATAGRIGSTVLAPGTVVQGTLNDDTLQQDWTLNGVAGQTVTISAVDSSGTGALDTSLRLIAPDGSEEAFNDDAGSTVLLNTPFDAQIADHELASSGAYTVRVERVNGAGSYRLGVVGEQPLSLSADGATRIQGSLDSALPAQRWTFEGQAGQVFTFTMQAESGALDPALRLLDPEGNMLTENDDAADTALGRNAQLVQVRLPRNGTYTLEATRFSGAGDYTLTVVATS